MCNSNAVAGLPLMVLWCFFTVTLLVGECDLVGAGNGVDVFTLIIASSDIFLKIFVVPMFADVWMLYCSSLWWA